MTVKCKAVEDRDNEVKRRGKASIEYYNKNDKPVYFCLGYRDACTESTLKVCRNCRDFVGNLEENLFSTKERLIK